MLRVALKTIYWSGYIGDQIFIWTLFWSLGLTFLFATVVASLGIWAGIPPLAFALDFVGEAVVALSSPVLMLALIGAVFAVVSFVGRWLLGKGRERIADPHSLAKGHPLTALLSALLRRVSIVPRPLLQPPASLGHATQSDLVLTSTSADLSGASPILI